MEVKNERHSSVDWQIDIALFFCEDIILASIFVCALLFFCIKIAYGAHRA